MSARAAPPVFLISGRDPLLTSGGSESYAVAQARATMLAGYEPHVFSVARRSEELRTDFGVLHRVASPVRPPRSIACALQPPWLVPAIVETVERVASNARGSIILHSFGAWSVSAAAAAVRLRRHGADAIPLATIFTALQHETSAKLESMVVPREPRVANVSPRRARVDPPGVDTDRGAIAAPDARDRRQLRQRRRTARRPLRRRIAGAAVDYSSASAFDDAHEPPALPEPLRGFDNPDTPLIVAVSRHDGRKGLDTLIGALTLLRDEGPPFRACLVGPGVLLGTHRKLVRRIGLERDVLITGRVPDATAYLRAADVFVLPLREEGSGSVSLLEALHAGVASVVTNVDGLPEDVTHEHDALLVAPGNRRTLARAIRRLIEEPELRARLGDNARQTFARRFAPDVFAAELGALYTELGVPASEGRAAERTASAT